MQIIEVSIVGVRSAVLTLRSQSSDLTFVVYPMIHVAHPGFYRQVQERLAAADVMVEEGVGGSVVGRALTLTYRILPRRRRSGLVLQRIDRDALPGEVIRADMTGEQFTRSWKTIRWSDRVLIWCLVPVYVVIGLVGSQRRLMERFSDLAMDDLPTNEEVLDGAATEDLSRVLLDERDRLVADVLVNLHRTRQGGRLTIAVVYGAAHVPAIVEGLYRLGYQVRTGDWLTVVPPSGD